MLERYKNRITPENIKNLNKNEIFVFGSNLRGSHGSGAAYMALQWGAKLGIGVGLHGQTYAIPTMFDNVTKLIPYVKEFIYFAQGHPNMIFLVTKIGCGIAGFTVNDIAPLFKEAESYENIYLPTEFWDYILFS